MQIIIYISLVLTDKLQQTELLGMLHVLKLLLIPTLFYHSGYSRRLYICISQVWIVYLDNSYMWWKHLIAFAIDGYSKFRSQYIQYFNHYSWRISWIWSDHKRTHTYIVYKMKRWTGWKTNKHNNELLVTFEVYIWKARNIVPSKQYKCVGYYIKVAPTCNVVAHYTCM